MAIAVDVTVGIFSAGVPSRMGDPGAFFAGEADTTGDASGGALSVAFGVPPDAERQFVFVLDSLSVVQSLDGGTMRIEVIHHHELANVALDHERATTLPSIAGNTGFRHASHEIERWLQMWPIWWRRDLGGSATERRFVRMTVNNVDTSVTNFRLLGRVYDARILASGDFHRLLPSHALGGL